jgi:hypothetical protein
MTKQHQHRRALLQHAMCNLWETVEVTPHHDKGTKRNERIESFALDFFSADETGPRDFDLLLRLSVYRKCGVYNKVEGGRNISATDPEPARSGFSKLIWRPWA